MEQLDKEKLNDEFADAAGATPSGKLSPSPSCLDLRDIDDIKLELESAALELEAAEAMKRAAEAKRRAAALLRNQKGTKFNDPTTEFKLDDEVSTKLLVSESKTDNLVYKCSGSTNDQFHVKHYQPVQGDVDKVGQLLSRIDLPKYEIPKFDGSPLQYVSFFRQFEENVENRIDDDNQRLAYLYQYCTGRAREAISGCLMYPAAEGYKRARHLLKSMFGQRHLIVRAMLDDITTPEPIAFDGDSLSTYANKLITCADVLEQLGFVSDLNSIGTLEKVLNKLPRFVTVDWVRRVDEIYQCDREPVFRDLCDFVCSKARIQSNRYSYLLRDGRSKLVKNNLSKGPPKKIYGMSASATLCYKCDGNHSLEDCDEFKALDVEGRWKLISRFKLCFMCLKAGHRINKCISDNRCNEKGCTKSHHPLLHKAPKTAKVLNASCQGLLSSPGVSLGIVPVIVQGPTGCQVANALLDTGADTSLIREDLARKLGLIGARESVQLNTPIGSATRSCYRVSFCVKSLENVEVTDVRNAYTVSSILDVDAALPSKCVLSKWSHLDGIELRPLSTPIVGVLLGLDIPEVHWVLEERRGKKGEPYADLTPLGWVLRGPLDHGHRKQARIFTAHLKLQEIEKNLQRFYDSDFIDNGSFENAPSIEDERAADAVEKSLEIKNGHLCVGLPWKDNKLKECCNKSAALYRLALLNKRLKKDPELKEKYSATINRYIQRGYAVKVTGSCDEGNVNWYLPHHAVFNPRKPDKVRVVFDCAAVFNGESLNKHLLQGPNLVSDLLGILIRFRQKPVALSADIEDMFFQVSVPESDQSALRFLWTDSCEIKVPDEYKLTVHPFGAVSSPFCASFALKKTATLFGHDYPSIVSQVVMDSFYVDDCLVSVSDESEAILLIEGLSQLLKRGGFKLTKWSSNNRKVLQEVPPADRSNAIKHLGDDALPTQRTLGLSWDMESDSFEYHCDQDESLPTRRTLLSRLASIYDPLGWIGPYILPMKQLFQELCRKGIGWDEKLDTAAQLKWQQCRRVLKGLERVKIPRWYAREPSKTACEVELHIFCDASELGYGAVAYLRFIEDSTCSRCALVMAKSRVSPLKVVTIPRLELMAAVLAVKLYKIVTREIRIPIRETVFWTDSAVVLYYIKDDKSRFSTFVANRVSVIRECSSPLQWRHVAGNTNPADVASRGISLQEEIVSLWFEGPRFLQASGRIRPDDLSAVHVTKETMEFKKVLAISSVSQESCLSYFKGCSSWSVLLKSVAWILRFKQFRLVLLRARPDLVVRVGQLTVQDLRESCKAILKLVQLESFHEEIGSLLSDSTLGRRAHSSLRKLDPVMIDGLLCVGGRLQWASLSEAAKHPVILPSHHFVTGLIIRYYHVLEGHVGCSQVLATVRQRFWIIRGRASVRRVVGKCLRCRMESARPCSQQMAPLPYERTQFVGHAFAHVGVDYFGPIPVKRGRTEEKRYGCLFTCLNVRAVHIEVTHSLSTDSFLQALARFMARRGQPKALFSDNGSNFKGAYAELASCLKGLSQSKISTFLLEREIEWHFNPPEASHWGGIWERLIRSVRKILRVISHGQRMTDETLPTFLAEVERIMNNRPLVPLTDDAKDLEALTPSKLLLLRHNDTFMDHQNFARSCVRLWRRVQLLADTFWKRWKTEYLTALQERQKWFDKSKPVEQGSLVLVIDDNTHRNKWPLGIVQETFKSNDGLVREVLVRTSHGVLRRDVRKLCLLEGETT